MYRNNAFNRYYEPTASTSVIETITGTFGSSIMLGFGFLAVLGFALSRNSLRQGSALRPGICFFVALGLYCARLVVRYYYFGDTSAVAGRLDSGMELSLGILLGTLLIGIPCLLLGASCRNLGLACSSATNVNLFALEDSHPLLLPWLSLVLCLVLMSFGWHAQLPGAFCLLLGLIIPPRTWRILGRIEVKEDFLGNTEAQANNCETTASSELLESRQTAMLSPVFALQFPLPMAVLLGLLLLEFY